MLFNLEKYLKSTRFKTTLWYTAIFFILEVVFGAVIYVYIDHTMRKELDYSLKKQAKTIYNFVKDSKVNLFEFEPDSIYSTTDELIYDIIFEALAFNPNNTFVQVSINNKIVFRTTNLGNITLKTDLIQNSNTLFEYYIPELSKYPIRAYSFDKDNYKIIVAFPLEYISKTLNELTNLYIIVTPLFLLLSFIGGFFLSFKALNRIDKIIKRTDEIDTNNLNTLLDGEEYDDEYGRLVKTLNRMIRRIKSSMDYMNQFTINASHELKTPLTILRGELELAIKYPKSREECLEIIKSSYEETLRLINIIERLFFITKLDNALIKINLEKVNLVDLIEGIVKDFKFFANEKNIKLITNYSNSNFLIDADPMILKQIFINLIDNAIKYGDYGSDILILCQKDYHGKISIYIKNKSEPIPKELIPKLFERFYRIETSHNRSLGGVGLGLAVVKQLIDLHKFDIKIDSDELGYFTVQIFFN